MKKILMALLITISLNAQDFRNVNWGCGRQTVKDTELGRLIADYGNKTGFLGYKTSWMNGAEYDLYYYFYQNKLAKAMFTIDEKTADFSIMAKEITAIAERLKAKYGDAVQSYCPTIDETGQEFERLRAGETSAFMIWKKNKTTIIFRLYGEKNVVTLEVGYYSDKYEYLIENYRKNLE